MAKNAAYAWRQMVFYLSLLDSETVSRFLLWAHGYLEAQKSATLSLRLELALSGLEWIAAGSTFDQHGVGRTAGERGLLGWTTERRSPPAN